MRGFALGFVAVSVALATACSLTTEGQLDVSGRGGGGTSSGTTTTTTSTGTSSGVGGQGGVGASGGGGEAGGGPENCLDGIDNDGNDDIDCADASCQADFECVPPLPSEWDGFVQVGSGSYPLVNVPCPGGGTAASYYQSPGGVSCSACHCSSPTGVCSNPVADCYDNHDNCGNGADYTLIVPDNQCYHLPPSLIGGDASCIMTTESQPMSIPSCSESGGTPSLELLWATEHAICDLSADSGGGCTGGNVCLPKADSAFSRTCITRDGDHPCPDDWTGSTAHSGHTDNRGCSTCSCGEASGATCSAGYVSVHDDGGCQNYGNGAVSVTKSCTDISLQSQGNYGTFRMYAGSVQGGSCQPSGVSPTGAVIPSGPMAICCQ